MKIEKIFEFTLSHKFPDGGIASIKFGTRETVTNVLDDINSADLEQFELELADKVYKQTLADFRRATKKNKIIKEVYAGIKGSVKSQENDRDAEKILEEYDGT